jgi:hypothetical protein
VRVDPDHMIDPLCQHSHRDLRAEVDRVGAGLGIETARQVCDGSRPTRADRLLIRPASRDLAGTGSNGETHPDQRESQRTRASTDVSGHLHHRRQPSLATVQDGPPFSLTNRLYAPHKVVLRSHPNCKKVGRNRFERDLGVCSPATPFLGAWGRAGRRSREGSAEPPSPSWHKGRRVAPMAGLMAKIRKWLGLDKKS